MSSWGYLINESSSQDYHEASASRIRNIAKRPKSDHSEEQEVESLPSAESFKIHQGTRGITRNTRVRVDKSKELKQEPVRNEQSKRGVEKQESNKQNSRHDQKRIVDHQRDRMSKLESRNQNQELPRRRFSNQRDQLENPIQRNYNAESSKLNSEVRTRTSFVQNQSQKNLPAPNFDVITFETTEHAKKLLRPSSWSESVQSHTTAGAKSGGERYHRLSVDQNHDVMNFEVVPVQIVKPNCKNPVRHRQKNQELSTLESNKQNPGQSNSGQNLRPSNRSAIEHYHRQNHDIPNISILKSNIKSNPDAQPYPIHNRKKILESINHNMENDKLQIDSTTLKIQQNFKIFSEQPKYQLDNPQKENISEGQIWQKAKSEDYSKESLGPPRILDNDKNRRDTTSYTKFTQKRMDEEPQIAPQRRGVIKLQTPETQEHKQLDISIPDRQSSQTKQSKIKYQDIKKQDTVYEVTEDLIDARPDHMLFYYPGSDNAKADIVKNSKFKEAERLPETTSKSTMNARRGTVEKNLKEATTESYKNLETSTRKQILTRFRHGPIPIRNIAEALDSVDEVQQNSEILRESSGSRQNLQSSSSRKTETIIVPKRKTFADDKYEELSKERSVTTRSRHRESREDSAERLPSFTTEKSTRNHRFKSRYTPETSDLNNRLKSKHTEEENVMRKPGRRVPSRGSVKSNVVDKPRTHSSIIRNKFRIRSSEDKSTESSSREQLLKYRTQGETTTTKSRRRNEVQEKTQDLYIEARPKPRQIPGRIKSKFEDSTQFSARSRNKYEASIRNPGTPRSKPDSKLEGRTSDIKKDDLRSNLHYTVKPRTQPKIYEEISTIRSSRRKPAKGQENPVTSIIMRGRNKTISNEILEGKLIAASSTTVSTSTSITLETTTEKPVTKISSNEVLDNTENTRTTTSTTTTSSITTKLTQSSTVPSTAKPFQSSTAASTAKTLQPLDNLTTTAKLERTTRSSDSKDKLKVDELEEIGENDNYPEHFRQLLLKNKNKNKSTTTNDLEPAVATTDKIRPLKYFSDSVEISSVDNLDRIKIQHMEPRSQKVSVKTSISEKSSSERFRPKFPQSSQKFMSKDRSSQEVSSEITVNDFDDKSVPKSRPTLSKNNLASSNRFATPKSVEEDVRPIVLIQAEQIESISVTTDRVEQSTERNFNHRYQKYKIEVTRDDEQTTSRNSGQRNNLPKPNIRAYRPKPNSDKYSRSHQNNHAYNTLNKKEETETVTPATTTENQKNQLISNRANFENLPTKSVKQFLARQRASVTSSAGVTSRVTSVRDPPPNYLPTVPTVRPTKTRPRKLHYPIANAGAPVSSVRQFETPLNRLTASRLTVDETEVTKSAQSNAAVTVSIFGALSEILTQSTTAKMPTDNDQDLKVLHNGLHNSFNSQHTLTNSEKVVAIYPSHPNDNTKDIYLTNNVHKTLDSNFYDKAISPEVTKLALPPPITNQSHPNSFVDDLKSASGFQTERNLLESSTRAPQSSQTITDAQSTISSSTSTLPSSRDTELLVEKNATDNVVNEKGNEMNANIVVNQQNQNLTTRNGKFLQESTEKTSITTLTSSQQELLDRVAILSQLLSNFRKEKYETITEERVVTEITATPFTRTPKNNLIVEKPIDILNQTRNTNSAKTNKERFGGDKRADQSYEDKIFEKVAQQTEAPKSIKFNKEEIETSTVQSNDVELDIVAKVVEVKASTTDRIIDGASDRNKQLPNIRTSSIEVTTVNNQSSTAQMTNSHTETYLTQSSTSFDDVTVSMDKINQKSSNFSADIASENYRPPIAQVGDLLKRTSTIQYSMSSDNALVTTENINQKVIELSTKVTTKSEHISQEIDSNTPEATEASLTPYTETETEIETTISVYRSQDAKEQVTSTTKASELNSLQRLLIENSKTGKSLSLSENKNDLDQYQQKQSSTENSLSYKTTLSQSRKIGSSKVIIVTPSNLPEMTTYFPQHTKLSSTNRISPVFHPDVIEATENDTHDYRDLEHQSSTTSYKTQNILQLEETKTTTSAPEPLIPKNKVDEEARNSIQANLESYILENPLIITNSEKEKSIEHEDTISYSVPATSIDLGPEKVHLYFSSSSEKNVEINTTPISSTTTSEIQKMTSPKLNVDEATTTKLINLQSNLNENFPIENKPIVSVTEHEILEASTKAPTALIISNNDKSSEQSTVENSEKNILISTATEAPKISVSEASIVKPSVLEDTSQSTPSTLFVLSNDGSQLEHKIDVYMKEKDFPTTENFIRIDNVSSTNSASRTATYRPRFQDRGTFAPFGTQSSTPTPKRDYVIYGILPNATVVQKEPEENRIPIHDQLDVDSQEQLIVYAILPNSTVVKKFPNGTIVRHIDSSVRVLDVKPWDLSNLIRMNEYLRQTVNAPKDNVGSTELTNNVKIDKIESNNVPLNTNNLEFDGNQGDKPENLLDSFEIPRNNTKSINNNIITNQVDLSNPNVNMTKISDSDISLHKIGDVTHETLEKTNIITNNTNSLHLAITSNVQDNAKNDVTDSGDSNVIIDKILGSNNYTKTTDYAPSLDTKSDQNIKNGEQLEILRDNYGLNKILESKTKFPSNNRGPKTLDDQIGLTTTKGNDIRTENHTNLTSNDKTTEDKVDNQYDFSSKTIKSSFNLANLTAYDTVNITYNNNNSEQTRAYSSNLNNKPIEGAAAFDNLVRKATNKLSFGKQVIDILVRSSNLDDLDLHNYWLADLETVLEILLINFAFLTQGLS